MNTNRHPLLAVLTLAAGVMAVCALALLTLAVGTALGQDDRLNELYVKHGGAKPKINGRVGYGFGRWDISGLGNEAERDADGLVTSLEADMIFTGGNGPLDYRFRWRMRGQDRPDALGDTGTFESGQFQTLRGHLRWQIGESLKLRIAKLAVTEVTSTTEVDPVQNLPCACYTGDLADKGAIDLQWTLGSHMLGVAISSETTSAMSTNGSPVREAGRPQDEGGTPGGSGNTAPSGNRSITLFGRFRLAGITFAAKIVTAEGKNDLVDAAGNEVAAEEITVNADGTVTGTPEVAGDGVDDFSGKASGYSAHLGIPLGAANLNIDLEHNASDLSGGATQTISYNGVSLRWHGLNLGVGMGVAQLEVPGSLTAETTQLNLSAHYRMPVGVGGWVGPELQTRTITQDDGAGTASEDEEITSIRWIMQASF